MILGGFLILPSSFDDDPGRKVDRTAISIFGLCLLTAGLSFSALVAFTIRQAQFQAETLFQPCLIYSAIGLLNVFYDFVVSSRYSWSTPALLVTVAAAIATIAYSVLFVIAQKRAGSRVAATNAARLTNISLGEGAARHRRTTSNTALSPAGTGTERWQDPTYYENYTRNAYPTAYSNKSPSSQRLPHAGGQHADVTEEELQRQQMLMLLLRNPRASTASATTYHIDWPGHDQEVLTPVNNSVDQPLEAWDGVWRGPPRTITLPRIERQM